MNEYNSYDILVEWAKQKVINKLKRKNRPQQKPARTYSEVSSGDVHSSISSCATDTLRTSKNATAKIQQKTQSAKNNIKKFQNNDFLIDFSSFQTVVRGLRKMLSLEYKGGSNYADYITPNGIFSFRLSNHNANGNNFESGHINVSVYVAYHKYDVPESEIDFKEFPITPETFETNPQHVVSCIVNGVDKALKGEGFSLPSEISTSEHYPQITTENKTTKDMKQNKQTIRLNERQLRQVIRENLKEFTGGIRPNARVEHPKFSVTNLVYEIRNTLQELQEKGEHLSDLLAQSDPTWFNEMGHEVQMFGEQIMAKSSGFLEKIQEDGYEDKNKISESKLKQIIKESIKKILKEDDCRYEETEEFTNLEDEILQYISGEQYQQMCRNMAQKKADMKIKEHLSKMGKILSIGEGKDYVGDIAYDWLAFWYGVDNGTAKNGRVNLYIMEKNPSIQYQYSNEKHPNIPIEKARERITEVINSYYRYAVNAALPTIEQLKEILNVVKQHS